MSDIAARVDCGPEGCTVDWLSAARFDVPSDPVEFMRLATAAGFGDGLPLIPPTEARVREHVAASGRFPDEVIGMIPPSNGRATVEKIAINAVMAGAPAEAMPLLITSIEAMLDPQFNLFALNTTTCCVVPAVFVNGPIRHALGIAMGPSCYGGAAGNSASTGRATRLVMRNLGGQREGISTKSVFGQPGRVSGIVVAEWEEESPWAPLSERRGIAVAADAVTVHGATGTIDIADIVARDGATLLEVIAKSLAFPGTNAFIGSGHHGAEIAVAIAPPWARLIAAAYPTIDDVQQAMYDHAWLPIGWWPASHQAAIRDAERVDRRGRVHLVESPDHLIVVVNGGQGNLHALAMHSFGPTRAVTAAVS